MLNNQSTVHPERHFQFTLSFDGAEDENVQVTARSRIAAFNRMLRELNESGKLMGLRSILLVN